jgi:hypothetical protein
MKKFKTMIPFLVLVILLMGLTLGASAAGENAYSTQYTTSITYQNISSSDTNSLQILFYDNPSDTSPLVVPRNNLAAGASTSLFVGPVLSSGFQGAAVMAADQPLVATLVQLPRNTTVVKNLLLSNGFATASPQMLLATVIKNTFDVSTIFSVQNADSEENTVTITFYDTNAANVHQIVQSIEPGAAFYVDVGAVGALGSSFNGSVVVNAERGDTSGGLIVASAMELSTIGAPSSAYEGVGTGSDTFYMPSALCRLSGVFNTAYAVQNTSDSDAATVTVELDNGYSETKQIGPGAKASFITCRATHDGTAQGDKLADTLPAGGYNGSAVITSVGAPVIAIGKASGGGLSTAFNGVSAGTEQIFAPYVRWATAAQYTPGVGYQRANLTIQNVGSTDITGDILVKYIGPDGSVQGTHTITTDVAPGAKVNSRATMAGLAEFGINGGAFGGGVKIEGPAGSELAAVIRISTPYNSSTTYGEDYNGQTLP